MNKIMILSLLLSISVANTVHAEVYQTNAERSWYLGGRTYTYSGGEAIKDTSGRTGWILHDNKWYYIAKNGIARNHPLMENGTTYYFKANGEWLEPDTEDYNTYIALLEQIDFAVKNKVKDFKLQVDGYDIADYSNLVDSYIGMYVKNYCCDPLVLGINFSNEGIKYEYESTQDKIVEHLDNIDKLINNIIAEVNTKETSIEKVRYINYKMLETFDYDDTLRNKSGDLLNAALNNNKIICFGYSYIFKDICTRVGLNAEIILGTTPYGTHSWNSVQIGNETKYVDVCWNETAKTNETYLLISKEEMAKDHFEDKTLKLAFLDKK